MNRSNLELALILWLAACSVDSDVEDQSAAQNERDGGPRAQVDSGEAPDPAGGAAAQPGKPDPHADADGGAAGSPATMMPDAGDSDPTPQDAAGAGGAAGRGKRAKQPKAAGAPAEAGRKAPPGQDPSKKGPKTPPGQAAGAEAPPRP